ncbi:MAG: hypothetical protein IIC85_01020 [Chloroflexi bacterium]|nr:hypothetical protein [Chloroflexota bacterium]
MNSENENGVGFRLPEDHLLELNRLAAQRGQSRRRLAKEIVTAALMDYGRFDELGHRLGVIERAVHHLVEQFDRLESVPEYIDTLRASTATAVSRILVAGGAQVDFDEAIAWTAETFSVEKGQ